MDEKDEKVLNFDVADLSLDVFELAGSGLEVESLTAGHGMPETAGSCGYSSPCGSCTSSNPCSCVACRVVDPAAPSDDIDDLEE
jgi:hypothetical protein